MPEDNPLEILLRHDRWATGGVLKACEKLTAEQFHHRFEIGPCSLHNTLTHMLGAMRAWTDTLSGTDVPRPRLEDDGQRRTPEQLLSLLEESWPQLHAEVGRRPLGEIMNRRTKMGTILTMTRAAIFVHVATHSMHHRAQCLNMLRHLGVSPLPPNDIIDWARTE